MNNSVSRRDHGFWQALPVAVLGWVLALWGVGYFLTRPVPPEPQPQVVEERLVELPAEAPPPASRPQEVPPPRQPLPQPTPQPQLAPEVPAPPPPVPAKPQALPPPPPPPPVAAAPSPTPVAGIENHGPVALNDPDPTLPEDLLDQVAGSSITVHVLIGADGSLQVDIPDRSLDPRIRKSIVEQLRSQWRFDPAVQMGKPVAITQDFTFRF